MSEETGMGERWRERQKGRGRGKGVGYREH